MKAASFLQAAIFDLDGLLVDSEPLWQEAEVSVFAQHGVDLTLDMVRSTKGRFVTEAVSHWHGVIGWEGASVGEVAEQITSAVIDLMPRRLELKKGAIEALDLISSRDLALAVASSSPKTLIAKALDCVGVGGFFEAVCSAEDEVAGKPDPAVFLSAARRLGVEPNRCVVLEDSPNGVRGALAAGMGCIAVPEPDCDSTDGYLAQADAVIESLAALDCDVLDWVERCMAKRATAAIGN